MTEPGIVVVAYGAVELLREALTPVAGLPVVVVDNSSSPEVQQAAASVGATYVDPGSNTGFARGVNLGVRALWQEHGERDVLLLNPDAVLTPADVSRLHEVLRAEQRGAAVAPVLTGPDGPQRVQWPWPRPVRMWREALGLLGAGRHDGDWLVGAALMLSAAAWTEVGPFDERFFLYAEETDWQRRAHLRGWSLSICEDVVVRHAGAATSTDPVRRELLFHAAAETYIRKWYGAGGWRSYRTAALVGAVLRSPRPGPKGRLARQRAVLYATGPQRRLAKAAE
jgi:GT2 family glycosyltransferase